ncbi:MAG: zinc-ribbon domain-containing protein [Deltaproteobacteria bacterium]|nr:zinc-ribbon domain-containing protein [Deltaproteobacteria bacterium]
MLVQCPKCQTTYRVSDGLVTAPNPTFRCSRCKHIFVLGLRAEASPVSEPVKPSSAPPRRDKEPELNFSLAALEKKETGEEKSAEVPASPRQDKDNPAETSTDPTRAEPAQPATGESFSFPDERPTASPVPEDLPPRLEAEPSPVQSEEKEDDWSLTRPQVEEESFTIPEESRSEPAPGAPSPTFEERWADALPLLEERQADPSQDPYRDRPLSIVPYVTLFGALVLIYALLTLMYQAQPKTIEAAINAVPWLGPSVLKNDHLRHGIVLQALRPGFQTIQGNREVFVLSGVAVNRNPASVREVRVEGYIFNAEGKEIDRQIISVGNAISSKILRDLTAQEISILQKLNPQKRFEIPPEESAGFVIVFLKPSAEVKNFSCRVLSVEGGA